MIPAPALVTPEPPKKGGARKDAGRKFKEGTSLSRFGVAAKAKGYTTTSLAKELGVSTSSASMYMTGQQRPQPETMAKIAEIFGEEFGLKYWLTIPKRPRN